MEPLIEARTLLIASAVVFAGLVLAVGLAWRELRAMRGPDRFARAFFLVLAGLLFYSLQGRIPALLGTFASNVLFAVGAACVLEGTRLYFGFPGLPRLTAWVGVTAAAAFGSATWIRDSGEARTVLSSAFLTGLLGAAAWIAWQHRHRVGNSVFERVTALGLATCALLFWARGVAVAAGLVTGDILRGSLWMAAPTLLCTLFAVVWTTTLLATTSRRLTTVVRSQYDLLANLLAVARAAGTETGIDTTLQKILEAARSATRATGASLLLLDEGRRFTRGLFSQGDATIVIGASEADLLLKEGLAGWAVRSGEIAVVRDVRQDARWYRIPAQDSIVRSALSAPIAGGPALLGVLTLIHPVPDHFGEDERQLIESTTAQIGLALRTAQIADARARATRHQAVLNSVLEISARRSSPEEIAAEATDAIVGGTSFTRVFLALPGEDGRFRLLGRTNGLADLQPRCDEGPLGLAFETGELQREERPGPGGREGADSAGAEHRIAIPLRHLGQRLGVVAFDGPARDGFVAADLTLAEALAEAISLGLGKEALARAREELSRMMVHDLRSPISGVLGALELLREARDLGETDRKLLDLADRNAKRLLKLVDGILELSRLEEGALPVRREEVRLPALVDEVLERTRPAAVARGLALESSVDADLPSVRADSGLVARVLENLLTNAVKFSAPGAGPIRVEGRLDGQGVVLSVRDSGPGVPDELRPRLFQKFAVGDVAGRGTGLGLPFCRLATEALGGRIWLEDPGPGAVFAFSLPLAALQAA